MHDNVKLSKIIYYNTIIFFIKKKPKLKIKFVPRWMRYYTVFKY